MTGVDFSAALLAARSGYFIRREGWLHSHVTVHGDVLVYVQKGFPLTEWRPTSNDLLALDWMTDDAHATYRPTGSGPPGS
jgi:hypothetical protein